MSDRRVKVLAVDNKPANLLALEAVLDEKVYVVLTALSGSAALETLKNNPDTVLILLDVQMPIMDGFEVARRIKKMPGFEEIPVIFITATCTEDLRCAKAMKSARSTISANRLIPMFCAGR